MLILPRMKRVSTFVDLATVIQALTSAFKCGASGVTIGKQGMRARMGPGQSGPPKKKNKKKKIAPVLIVLIPNTVSGLSFETLD